ncbi:MAG: flagellar basal body P-ring formation protein FlgA [SAR324 cluster bacterium]|uniref:Flagellar basal body P-ring formation protein FlgA n=1 Tax=SAR324 cluster bacterium TaxID=2024889 RepID=A0A7X9FQ69_9DELT|nr:flagellar basal body P-ring formation protein FlgA [SAR324 cluster bacterium]
MRKKFAKLLVILLLVLSVSGEIVIVHAGNAEPAKEYGRSIIVNGRSDITVTTPSITLGDLAEVKSLSPLDDETVIGIKKIIISESPKPGKGMTINASQILDRLKDEGVNLHRIGYTFPSLITVNRASRLLTLQEIKHAIENYFKENGREANIKQSQYDKNIVISPGDAEIKAIPFSTRDSGRGGFDVQVSVNGAEEARFSVMTGVEEWKEVPVAARTLNKGSLIGAEDIRMARLNINALPKDVAMQDSEIIGREVAYEVPQGDFFKESKLNIPPLIPAGQQVTVRYRIKALEATAAGIALDAGVKGQDIRVKNAVSKRIISGTVIEPGLVEVRNQGSAIN